MLMRKGKIKEIKYPYDLGCWHNVRAVLGEKLIWWCWPQESTGDGLHFETGRNVSKWLSSVDEEEQGGSSSARLLDETISDRMA